MACAKVLTMGELTGGIITNPAIAIACSPNDCLGIVNAGREKSAIPAIALRCENKERFRQALGDLAEGRSPSAKQ